MGTKREDSFVGSYISKKFKGFDVSWGVIKKGFCVYTVRDYINKVSNKVRKYNIPSVLEIYTYRYKGHSMSDPDTTYRLKDEISSYKASRDPITKFENILLSEGLINTKLIGKALNSIRSKIN
jgi:pyruvate dehydrogenase E1 component alpha subunit